MKTTQAEEHNAQWEIKMHGLKKIDRKNEITKHVMKGGEQKKVNILFKKKKKEPQIPVSTFMTSVPKVI